jgi:hypothetical protein
MRKVRGKRLVYSSLRLMALSVRTRGRYVQPMIDFLREVHNPLVPTYLSLSRHHFPNSVPAVPISFLNHPSSIILDVDVVPEQVSI